MGKTSIEWTDHSINPIRAKHRQTGAVGHYCEMVSAGCANCYSSNLQKRFRMPRFPGANKAFPTLPIGEDGGVDVGELRLFLDESKLDSVIRRQKPTKFFWCDMTDLFGSWVPDGWIVRCLSVMYHTPWHTHQVLTKRPDRMRDFFRRWTDLAGESEMPKMVRGPEETREAHPSGRGQLFAAMLDSMGQPPAGCAFPSFDWMEGPRWWEDLPANLWLGVSVENQSVMWRVEELAKIPVSVRFVSAEPLLGAVDFTRIDHGGGEVYNALTAEITTHRGHAYCASDAWPIDWIIGGGESGRNSRPMHPSWVRGIRDQCQAAGTSFFFKQWGEWYPADERCLMEDDRVAALVDGLDPCKCGPAYDLEFYGLGKRAAGRTLDGREWSDFPVPQ